MQRRRSHWHWLPVLLLHLVTLSCIQGAPADPRKVLPNIRELQIEAVDEPFHDRIVETRGVVTWVDETAGKVFYIQDETGGVRVMFNNPPWPRMGDVVAVRGTLTRGSFSPDIVGASFQKIGKASLPIPFTASAGGLLNGAYNGEFVMCIGWVRSAQMISPSTLSLVLSAGADRITVRIADARKLNPQDLIAAQVSVHGVASPIKARGTIRQLVEVQILVVGQKGVQVLNKPELADVWNQPFTSLANAFQYRPGQTRGERIRVRGQVVFQGKGVTYLNDGKSGLAVREVGPSTFRIGDWVEAVGFADLENFLPVLADATIRPSKSTSEKIAPRELPASALLDGLQHANYVTVTGRLLDRMQQPATESKKGNVLVLALQSPLGVFTAELERGDSDHLLPDLEPGSTLQISGICIVQTDSSGNPASFKILVPDAGQIHVTQPASFFTVKRLLLMLSATLGMLLLVAALTLYFVRRNVRLEAEARTREAELHERHAIAGERNRLARDLHDTLEQGLTSVRLQLQSIGPNENEASELTQKRLATVRNLVQQCHVEMRQSVWNLRSVGSDQFDLGQALERSARSLVLGSSIQVDFHQQREDTGIPHLIEDNLLRIGQEALTNAVKHASASHLTINLTTTSERAILVISDDGCGMRDPGEKAGHYGLVGMRERVNRIGGELSISSTAAAGSTVQVEVPLNFDNNNHSSS